MHVWVVEENCKKPTITRGGHTNSNMIELTILRLEVARALELNPLLWRDNHVSKMTVSLIYSKRLIFFNYFCQNKNFVFCKIMKTHLKGSHI